MTPERSPRRRLRRALGSALALCLVLWMALAAAFAARDYVAVNGVPSPLRLVFGDHVRVFRWQPLRDLANRWRGPVRVGLQVGHLDATAQPEELASLRVSTGAHWDGVDEVDVNAAIVEELAGRLRDRGIVVDVLPATVPPRYRADLFLSIHVDANADEDRNGYKSAHFVPVRNPHELVLKLKVDRAVLAGTPLADDDGNVTGNMFRYYAFNNRRFRHAVHPRTPGLLVELGYLSNPADGRLLEDPSLVVSAIERGVVEYLREVGRL